MKKELDDKLCAKYPKIFANRNKTKYESCFYYGFEHGDGWYDLLDRLCNNLQIYLDTHLEIQQVVVDQVKEKFGTLNFYHKGGDDYTWKLVMDAGHESATICETCGSSEEVTNTIGWIKYLCKTCMKKLNEEKLKI